MFNQKIFFSLTYTHAYAHIVCFIALGKLNLLLILLPWSKMVKHTVHTNVQPENLETKLTRNQERERERNVSNLILPWSKQFS